MKFRIQECAFSSGDAIYRVQRRVFGIWFDTNRNGEVVLIRDMTNFCEVHESIDSARRVIERKTAPKPKKPKWRTVE